MLPAQHLPQDHDILPILWPVGSHLRSHDILQ
jgi:hypothetical protein